MPQPMRWAGAPHATRCRSARGQPWGEPARLARGIFAPLRARAGAQCEHRSGAERAPERSAHERKRARSGERCKKQTNNGAKRPPNPLRVRASTRMGGASARFRHGCSTRPTCSRSVPRSVVRVRTRSVPRTTLGSRACASTRGYGTILPSGPPGPVSTRGSV